MPEADVGAYLTPQMSAARHARSSEDRFRSPDHPASAAWYALEGARRELRQLLVDGELVAVGVSSSGRRYSIKPQVWLGERGAEPLYSGIIRERLGPSVTQTLRLMVTAATIEHIVTMPSRDGSGAIAVRQPANPGTDSTNMEIDAGYMSRHFLEHEYDDFIELADPCILVCANKIQNMNLFFALMEDVISARRALLIFARDLDEEALSTLVINKIRGGMKVAAVRVTGNGEALELLLRDIATVIGTNVFESDLGMRLTVDRLGTAKRTLIYRDRTLIIDGGGRSLQSARAMAVATLPREVSGGDLAPTLFSRTDPEFSDALGTGVFVNQRTADSKKPPFDAKQAKALLAARKVSNFWPVPPTEHQSRTFLLLHFNGVPNEPHRRILRELWPKVSPGPRRKPRAAD